MYIDGLVGGTIDITAHQVMENGNVKELIKATGGNWGGTRVDEEYLDFIKCLIGEAATSDINQSTADGFFEACRDFESAKRTIKPKSDLKFNVRVPLNIRETYKKTHSGKELTSVESFSTKWNKNIKISFTGDKLRLLQSDAVYFFTQSVEKIVEQLKTIFKQKDGRGISTIILVGGYAESPVLFEGIKSSFPQMRTIIPKDSAFSVLRGAVIFGHNPDLIRERKSKYTYGIRIYEKFDPAKHDIKYMYMKDGKKRCGEIFSKLLEVDKSVTVGEYQNENQYTIIRYGEKGNLELYTSTSKNPAYVDENNSSFIGHILSPGHSFLLNETIIVKMRFGETEIEINANQPKSQNTKRYYLGQN